ncbi:MAG TPA: lytic transglycosylase domain-containing protein [Kiritimatiellia bacterium]|nr:lytic transglycosylase domain-containing protein [Kiritimatiellia bacterium]HNS80705.1 lytic transglycosylase domain-containing protein [Kiritimatiellia bacterium]HPA77274.1 lytic transglycosylase domain-containing protein [Kiritimatiellia bacterium]HQQ03238.1 lytic transglycosylase domain-containing protein [Kiritimatiellia bacterium]
MTLSRKKAWTVLYWNVVFAATVVCLGLTLSLRQMHAYDMLIVKIGREHNVDPRLISAIIWKESRFDPVRTGQAGEIGLMQVREGAYREWEEAVGERHARHELFNPEINIRAGTWYFARAIRTWSIYSDPIPYALAHYNAGYSNAKRWAAVPHGTSREFWNNITYPGTQRYVRDILARYRGGI